MSEEKRVVSDELIEEVPSTVDHADNKFINVEKNEFGSAINEINPELNDEYLINIAQQMTDDEARQILINGLDYHDDDWNFPQASREKFQLLLQGPKACDMDEYTYSLSIRSEATLLHYFSPYAEVRAVCDPYDDPTIAVETIRSYFLALLWSLAGITVNVFFGQRFPGIYLSSQVLQMLLYPSGVLLEKTLPDWGFTLKGVRHSLNPGKWTFKEQMFATICFNVSINASTVYITIVVQKVPRYYNSTFVNFGYEILYVLCCQIIGFGFAGMLRRFSVYPVKTLWPDILPTIAMNRSLLKPERRENIHGWTISRYRFFFLCVFGMFCYFWIPDYLFTALSSFNWITWIAPQNFNLAVITGTHYGVGLNPWPTFDWNVITTRYNLATPFFSTCQQYLGNLISAMVILAVFYTNTRWAGYLPINSSSVYANDGSLYNVSKAITNNIFDNEKYQKYSPPFFSAGVIVSYASLLVTYPMTFCYMFLNQYRLVKQSFIDFYKGIRYGKGSYDGEDDPHSKMMRHFKEVPDWWFLVILALTTILAIVLCKCYPINTPVWVIFFCMGINLVFLIPATLLHATAGYGFYLNTLIQVIIGVALPGNPQALLFAQTLGAGGIDSQATTFVSDQKLAHYSKLPPRAVFRGQLIAVVVTSFVGVSVQNWVMNNIKGFCDNDQPDHFTCANSATQTYTSSVEWGVIGPVKVYKGIYPFFKWCYLIGACVGIGFFLAQRYGPRLRLWAQKRLSESTFEKVDRTIFAPFRVFAWVNPVLIIVGFQGWAAPNLSYWTPGFYLSFVFMYYIRRRYLQWWEKYNYVLSAAFTAGVAIAAIIMYFAVQYKPKSLVWWGNTVSTAGLDGTYDGGLLPIPAKGYFGPDPGNYP